MMVKVDVSFLWYDAGHSEQSYQELRLADDEQLFRY
jgi:hypothetical protein